MALLLVPERKSPWVYLSTDNAHSSLPQSPSAGIQPGSPPLQGSTDAASLAEIAPPLAEWSETVLAQAVPEFALLSGSLVSATGGIILEAG